MLIVDNSDLGNSDEVSICLPSIVNHCSIIVDIINCLMLMGYKNISNHFILSLDGLLGFLHFLIG